MIVTKEIKIELLSEDIEKLSLREQTELLKGIDDDAIINLTEDNQNFFENFIQNSDSDSVLYCLDSETLCTYVDSNHQDDMMYKIGLDDMTTYISNEFSEDEIKREFEFEDENNIDEMELSKIIENVKERFNEESIKKEFQSYDDENLNDIKTQDLINELKERGYTISKIY